tara:strand:+ start:384 stop:602 length:219 start_codon:yes stop_codon:yes gene_type:complete
MKYLLSILLITFIYTQPDGYDCNGQLNGPAVGSLLVFFILSAIGIDFNRGIVGGVCGAIFGSWANSYLSKKK